jgi:NAD(P)-dependent dehydrogenase (short-subunit alcohol dehydrogenase family)
MPEVPLRFEGRTALIVGASGAVGKAITLALAAEGARTGLVGRRLDALQHVSLGVARGRPAPVCYPADVTSDEDLARLASEVARDFENLDVLVNSAGIFSMGRVEYMDTAAFDAQYRINLRAPYALARAFLPLLRKSRGQIVFINSSLGLGAKADVAQYAATKHGLKAIAEGLREEVNRDGIRVLSVFLGRTAGEMQRGIHAREGRAYDGERLIQPRDVACIVLAALSLDRTAEVTDVTIRPLAPPDPAKDAAYEYAIRGEGVA